LAEFHQVEGVVADYDITLGDLIGKYDKHYSGLTALTWFRLHEGVLRKDGQPQA
jgi:phenylalanyl-tRNA synthetase alpha subunit